jgi:hypothetical protein
MDRAREGIARSRALIRKRGRTEAFVKVTSTRYKEH